MSTTAPMSSLLAGSEPLNNVPSGHVRLVLVLNPPFYLEIPVNEILRLCMRPRKYLVFLAWCILGTEGGLAVAPESAALELDGPLDDGGLYYYVSDGGTCTDLSHAVDLEVIKERSAVPSETTNTRDDFANKLFERDGCCVFTGSSKRTGNGIHIIPYKRGSEWFRNIIENRPNNHENVGDLTDINDIRNGVFVVGSIHSWFDPRDAVILKTPNRYLDRTDIPPRADRPLELPRGVAYPRTERYTLQWLEQPDAYMLLTVPNNVDATFISSTGKRKPSGLLLHYNYGAAAVKRWGHGAEVLEIQPNPARPAVPIPAPMGPPKMVHDRGIAIQKRNPAQRTGPTNMSARNQPGEIMDLAQVRWDEDDVMLFLWGNSRAATERHRKKQEESTQFIEKWNRGLPAYR